MVKHKRDKLSRAIRDNPIKRPGGLGDQLNKDDTVHPDDQKQRSKDRNRAGEEDPEFVDKKTTKRILKQARLQQQQLEDEFAEEDEMSTSTSSSREKSKVSKGSRVKKTVRLAGTGAGDEDADESDDDEFALISGDEDDAAEQDKFSKEINIDPDDERALEMFMNKNAEPTKKLGEILMEKLTEKQTEIESQFSEAGVIIHKVDPRVEAMFEGVRDVLKKYRSGKLPKAFKLIPRLANWEQILHITDPCGWSAAAMYQATRIFASNLKEKMAQRFFNLVLLPRVRDDIAEFKKLNYHLYQALRKALFKPAAFMKGFLIPLCESGTCTLREAVIIGSVLAKNSIPLLHSSAAMLKIAEMDYSGANSIFLRIFIDKKYALPYRVIDGIVYHFLKFERDKRLLPVLWHQAFLSFVQRYKEYISSEQKAALQAVLRVHLHQQITPEIRRELMNSKCRDEVVQEESNANIAVVPMDV